MSDKENNKNLLLETEEIAEDNEYSLRPRTLNEFIGQQHLKSNLKVFIDSAKARSKAIDHILFFGPPGLGKTTLAQIVANELGVGFKATSGPILLKAGDLAAILTNLKENDVLFIDEIHRISANVEEILYPAMEDFQLDLMIGEGPAARSIRVDLPKFTLIGATTRSGLLASPLRDRFGIPMRMEFYTPQELAFIVKRNSELLNVKITEDGANEIAKRSRGTPRIAVRLLKRVRDFALVYGDNVIDQNISDLALTKLDVDYMGLDSIDRKYLHCICDFYDGGPVGVETIAAVLSEKKDTLEEVVEPYLMQKGLVQRTSRGRIVSKEGYKYLGLTPSSKNVDIKKENKELFQAE